MAGGTEAHLRSNVGGDEARDTSQTDTEIVTLKRKLGLPTAIGIVIGIVIGSGIFISPKGVTRAAGSVGLSLILWAVGGIIAMLGALSYAELGLLIPEAGGAYMYLLRSFGGAPAFLWIWTKGLFLKPSSLAVITLTCARYILAPLYDDSCGAPPEMHIKLLSITIILLLVAVNVYSVDIAARVQVVFTVAKVLALVVIIIGGMVKLGQGYTANLTNAFEGSNNDVGQIVTGLYSAMWAYDGWDNLNAVLEELVRPEVNIVRAFVIAIPTIALLYILVNVSYFSAMSVSELLAAPAVGVTWAELAIPVAVWIIPVSVAVSTFGAANGSLFTCARLYFAAARQGHVSEIASMLHVRRFTPAPASLLDGGLAVILVLAGEIQSLINAVQFTSWLFFGLTMVCLLVLRRKMSATKRIFKVPLICPIIVLLFSIMLTLVPLIFEPDIWYLYASIVVLAGLIVYVPFIYYGKELPCIGRLTEVLQLLLQVSPTDEIIKIRNVQLQSTKF